MDFDPNPIPNEIEKLSRKQVIERNLLAAEPTDTGNAECVKLLFGDQYLYADPIGWHRKAASWWQSEGAENALHLDVAEVLRQRQRVAAATHRDDYKPLIRAATTNVNRIKSAAEAFRWQVSMPATKFNADPDLINVGNGAIHLPTGMLIIPERDPLFTYQVNARFNPQADYREWLAFLIAAVGERQARFLQLLLGGSLSGHFTREEIFSYWFGPPRAGKGLIAFVLTVLLTKLLIGTARFGDFAPNNTSSRFKLFELWMRKLIFISESKKGDYLDPALVKGIVGRDMFSVERKYHDPINVTIDGLIIFMSNAAINTDEHDDAFWHRAMPVEFLVSHVGEENKTLKERYTQPEFLEGVLLWLVEGCKAWYSLGSAGLKPTAETESLKQQMRNAIDSIAQFVEDVCVIGSETETSVSVIYQEYKKYCDENGLYARSNTKLTEVLMKEFNVERVRTRVGGKQVRAYGGIGLRY